MFVFRQKSRTLHYSHMTTMSQSIVASSGENKSKKYDRQLRLWGDHGQSCLELAKVCLINATATGTEILKNLILPGVGSFTIVDGQTVTGDDAGNNFYLDRNSIGQSRAKAATELLLELNEDVCGDYIEDSMDNLLDKCATFFNMYRVVIATNLPEKSLLRLAAVLWDSDIPLVVCRSYGLIAYIRLVLREHTVVESHPDNVLDELRLDRPFDSFVQFCDSLDLSAMTRKERAHVPWLVILYKHLQLWKQEHDGNAPKTYQEKKDLKQQIRQGFLHDTKLSFDSSDDGDIPADDQENIEEAIHHVNTALLPSRIPDEVQKILGDDSCLNLHSESKPFWIMARAVKEFVDDEGQGLLPVRGVIPDMTSDSEKYVQLHSLYREQAAVDIVAVTTHLLRLLQSIGRDEPLSLQRTRSPASSPATMTTDTVTDDYVRSFCKHASFLRVIRSRSLAAEYDPATARVSLLAEQLDDADSGDTVVYYVLLRAVDRFFSQMNRYPGLYDEHVELDIPAVKGHVHKLLQEWGLSQQVKDEFVHEMCHYGACEIPSVAALIGGVAAQEVIKVITGQFIPLNNTFIYNAIKQTSVSLDL